VDDWASLPALLLLLSVFSFLAAPADHAYSRYLEHQADTYALEVIHGVVPDAPEVAAQAFQILGEIDLEDPDPPAFIKFWLYTHPPLGERIVFARTYDPWSRGQAPQFVK
jgi:Zn-dependent protease with chaperone function